MEYIVKCRGKEYVTRVKYFYEYALSLEDNDKCLSNPRMRFIINMAENFRLKKQDINRRVRRDNTIGSLHPLAQEMHKVHLSYEDEELLDDILGNDPYTPLY